ncbi:MAG: aldolase catalytic domain-containing protein [Spirochaetales bacterium]|nr:aldolase catalytic domain-containing protein [Spirochaetales bacterium]
MYRPEIKVLDCTIRDGGLINKWQFSDKLVRDTYKAVADAGVDYMELGYRASKDQFDPKEYGKWRFCDEEDVKKVLDGIELKSKLSCMVDIGRVNPDDIPPATESIFSLFRTACYLKDIDKAIDLTHRIQDKGYETSINIMAVSTNLEKDIEEGLTQLSESSVPNVYVVDSYGSMYSEDITFLTKKYQEFLPGKTLGIHAHNNKQLAFGNTIQSIIDGCNMIDGSIYGIGRGAGNCPLELLVDFLKNPKYNVRPLLEVIQNHYLDLRKEIEWGYIIPYMITGGLNEHPRTAIAVRQTEEKDDYVSFYDKMTTPEPQI